MHVECPVLLSMMPAQVSHAASAPMFEDCAPTVRGWLAENKPDEPARNCGDASKIVLFSPSEFSLQACGAGMHATAG